MDLSTKPSALADCCEQAIKLIMKFNMHVFAKHD